MEANGGAEEENIERQISPIPAPLSIAKGGRL